MSSSYEKSVKGATKQKLAAPKSKYIEHILKATRTGESGVGEILRTLQLRLRDTTWTIVFKSLIVVHLMIREGEPVVTLRFLSEYPSKLAINTFSDVQTQGGNIRHYHSCLLSRAKSFKDTRVDWVREGKGRLKTQTVDKGLLRESESVQKQIAAVLRCDLFAEEPENEISLTAFRLITMDLLVLYGIMNEGTINILEHYFEMSKVDAERALAIYKTFGRQTEDVVKFLGVARKYEHATRLQIPNLKHAPTGLAGSLEEYLNDTDFDVNRRQYLAQQEAKRTGRPVKDIQAEQAKKDPQPSASKVVAATAKAVPASPPTKGPAPDFIDFFESIEQNQQVMSAPPQQQLATGHMVPQYGFQQPFMAQNGQMGQPNRFSSTNPFAHMVSQQTSPPPQNQNPFGQPQFNYGQQTGFQPQSQFSQPLGIIPQDQQASFPSAQPQQFFSQPQQQSPFSTGAQPPQAFGQSMPQGDPAQNQGTNPFRASTIPPAAPNSSSPFQSAPPQQGLQRQGTNPFARSTATASPQNQGNPFAASSGTSPFFTPPPAGQAQAAPPAAAVGMQPMRTGTNPFARSSPAPNAPGTASPLSAQATGTNPFRQGAFINQQTGLGWQQSSNQGTMGGLETANTVPVFPRPAGQPQFNSNPQGQPFQ